MQNSFRMQGYDLQMSLNPSHKHACMPSITAALVRTHCNWMREMLNRLILKQNIEWWLEITEQVTSNSDNLVIKSVSYDV